DIYVDFQGWVPKPDDYQRFVARSRKNTWHTAVHHDGRLFTGFTFGRDSMVARLYDKSLEISQSGKVWMRDVWTNARNGTLPVWRLEFQLRRQVLKECGVDTPEGAIEQRSELWSYATEWLSLRAPRRAGRRVRWPVDDVWLRLAASELELPAQPLVRQRIRKRDESVLVRGLAGYASSLAAMHGVKDLDVAMAVSRHRVAEHMRATGRDFEELVDTKRKQDLQR
ncbi:MAG TPA: hypothetical protein VHQ03_10375, partial [Candidatus Dormibacteraeota bacterium]|nr:hypothetical protein [Candidatus Dormibacteraeota bacterium]